MIAKNRRRGQILIMATLITIPLFGMLGLVTDIGYMHYVKMTTQSAAEAAAQSAMIDFHHTMGGATYTCGTPNVLCTTTGPQACSSSPSSSILDGCRYAQGHGFAASSITYEAGTGNPPTAPNIGGSAYWVTFRVSQNVHQLFSAVLGRQYMNGLVVGRSTAAVVGATDCIYALDPTMQHAVSVGGTANLTSTCGLFVNSNDPCALYANGGGAISAPEYDVVGGACAGTLTPAANTGVAPTTDPLQGLAPPSSGPYNCPSGGLTYPNGGGNGSTINVFPGVYCGGIQVKNNTVIFHPGIYTMVGGGLTTQDANSHITGTGVMIYNTFDPADHQNQYNTFSPINIAANSTVSLTAPITGTYAGTLFFDDRNAPTGSTCGQNGNSTCQDNYGGGSAAVYQGIIYDRNNCINMFGNSSINTQYTMVVADCISMVGTTGFNNNYSSLPGGASPLQQVMVVE